MNDKPKPIHTIRVGSIHAAIWSNPGQHGPFYNVTIERRFRDGEDRWQSSTAFSRDDLLVVAKVADAAHTFVCEKQALDRADNHKTVDPTTMNGTEQAETGQRRSR